MKWPWQRRETRSGAGSGSYTDTLIQLIMTQAGGKEIAIPGASGAVEMVSGLVSRSLSAAEVNAASALVEAAVSPGMLSLAGRELVRRGEALFRIRTQGGAIMLDPAYSVTVTGGYDPDTWEYELTLGGPSETATVKCTAAQVLHFRYAVDAARPWQGVGPLQSATLAARLTGAVSGALADEAGTSRGYVLPLPKTDPGDGDEENTPTDALEAGLQKLRGELAMVESMAGNWQADNQSQTADWKPRRIGADPPQSLVELHNVARADILAAFGISAALFSPGDGTASREAFRLYYHNLLRPLARCIEQELREKLDAEGLTLEFAGLGAADVQGRSRAFSALAKGGMAIPDAAANAGLRITGQYTQPEGA